MAPVFLSDLRLNAQICGPQNGAAMVLLHGLGQDLTIWDGVVDALPELRILRIDLRGHGQSDSPAKTGGIGAMIHDVERVMAHFGITEAVICGCSLGGLIAQGLATKRKDLLRGLVLSNTATRLGLASHWQAQIETVQAGGLEAISQDILSRWLGRKWQEHPALPRLRAMLLATPPQGWAAGAAAIAGTDFYTQTAELTLPVLVIASGNDLVTPPDLVREMAELIQHHRFVLLRGLGHLPMLEAPDAYAAHLRHFLNALSQQQG